jgi:dolichol kinase
MKKTQKFELRRQSIHFLGFIYVIASYFLGFKIVAGLLAVTLFVAATHAFFRPIAKKVPIVRNISDFFDSLARKEEREERIYWGATTLFLSLLVLLLVFNDQVHIWRTAALVVLLGDSFSTIFGKTFGKVKLPWNKDKSWAGLIGGLIAAFIGALTQVTLLIAFIAALVGLLVESLPIKVNDNISIPVTVGVVVWLLLL